VLASTLSAGTATAWLVAAYLLGTFPTALVAGRRQGVDPRRVGSGNPGATNMLRSAGRRAGAITLVGDVAKGALAAGAGWVVGGHAFGVACGLAAVVGHVLPVTRGLRGGKGVATGAGVAAVVFPLPLVASVVAFAVVVRVTRTVSLASMAAVALLPPVAALAGAPAREVAGLVACALLVVFAHRRNIGRLVQGVEPRVGDRA
jgi:acyl phosphate:glycerol-3-phosphate acyltransferase